MKKFSLFSLLVLALASVSTNTSFASRQPRGSEFPATVNDGTPTVLTRTTSADEVSSVEALSPAQEPDVTEVKITHGNGSKKIQKSDTRELEELRKSLDELRTANQQLQARLIALETGIQNNATEEQPASSNQQQVSTKNNRTAGEKIPQDKIQDISARLKYAYDIAKRFGVAYDYRVMTLQDFKRVLSKLEDQKPRMQAEN